MADPLLLAPGALVPGSRYQLVRWLGDGGMGVVYEAEHVDLGRRVALKILRVEVCYNSRAIQRFRDEARAACRASSAYVTEVFDFAELADGRAYYTMELLEGRDLLAELGTSALPPARTIAILRQVCKGLAATHDAGIVHRDVKPENVQIVRREGRDDAVKLLDFGVHTMITDTGSANAPLAGTPAYMAPEMIAGLGFDARVDIYAVGCMAFQLLCGRVPHDDLDDYAILQAHLDRAPPSLTELAEGVPAALAAVVTRCLSKQPEHRFADMRDLEAALCEAQVEAGITTPWDDLPLPEVEPQRRDRLLRLMPEMRGTPTRRRRALWAFGGVLGLGVALGLAAAGDDKEAQSEVERLANGARAAAAKAYYVYPPADNASYPTAYRLVLQLEDHSSAGEDRAAALRTEFAATLVRLGDSYWQEQGGKPFSIDYYAAAIVFDPTNDHARRRASLTVGELVTLRHKASELDFSETELLAAEPLVVLAELGQAERQDGIAAVRAKRRSAEAPRATSPTTAFPRSRPARSGEPGAEALVPIPIATPETPAAPVDAPGTIPALPTADKRSPSAARRAVASGRAAIRARRYDDAERHFGRALAANPQSAAAAMGLSEAHFQLGNYGRAVRFAKRAVRLSPRRGAYRLQLGDAYYKTFRYKDALTQYLSAARLGHPKAKRAIAKTEAKLRE